MLPHPRANNIEHRLYPYALTLTAMLFATKMTVAPDIPFKVVFAPILIPFLILLAIAVVVFVVSTFFDTGWHK